MLALQYLPGKTQAQERIIQNRLQMFDFYQTLIDEHRETLDVDNSRDLIDVYLIEIEKAKTEGRAGELFEGRDHGKYNAVLIYETLYFYYFS